MPTIISYVMFPSLFSLNYFVLCHRPVLPKYFFIILSSCLSPPPPPLTHIYTAFLSFIAIRMINIYLEKRRFRRSSAQSFHLIKTHLDHIVIALGSTGNAYVLTVSPSSIKCTCPDDVQSCKHIIFLCTACGLVKRRTLHITFSHASLLAQLHSAHPTPLLRAALLDTHTTKLCSAHTYPPCFFCQRSQRSSPSRVLVLCSKCGFLSHDHCLRNFLDKDNNDVTFASTCPRCGKFAARLSVPISFGFRNFSNILRHQGYHCLYPPSSSTLVSSANDTNQLEAVHHQSLNQRGSETNPSPVFLTHSVTDNHVETAISYPPRDV